MSNSDVIMPDRLNSGTKDPSDYSRLDILKANGITTNYSNDIRTIICTKGTKSYTLSVFQNTYLENIEKVFGELIHREYWG